MKSKYHILHYSGDTDGCVPTYGTQMWFNELPVAESEEKWRKYMVGDRLGGYLQRKDKVVLVTVHGAGHTAA